MLLMSLTETWQSELGWVSVSELDGLGVTEPSRRFRQLHRADEAAIKCLSRAADSVVGQTAVERGTLQGR